MSMNNTGFVEFSKPFIDAAKNVFETMVGTSLEPQAPTIKKDHIARGEVSAMLGLTGKLEKEGGELSYKAMLVFSFPYETYCKVASAILSESYTSYCDEIVDVGGEIVNMIMGNAKRDLRKLGYTSDMAIPTMIEGKNHSIQYHNPTTIVLIPIKSSLGDMYMELCYQLIDNPGK